MNYCLLSDVYGNNFNNVNYINNNTDYTLFNKNHIQSLKQPLQRQQEIEIPKQQEIEIPKQPHKIYINQKVENDNLLKQLYNKNINEINNKINKLTNKIYLKEQKIIKKKQNIIIKKSPRVPKKISTIINQKQSVIHNIIYGLLLLLCFDLYLKFVNK